MRFAFTFLIIFALASSFTAVGGTSVNAKFWDRYVPDPNYVRDASGIRLELQKTILVSGETERKVHEKAGEYTAFTQTTPGKQIKAQFLYPVPDELKNVDVNEARTLVVSRQFSKISSERCYYSFYNGGGFDEISLKESTVAEASQRFINREKTPKNGDYFSKGISSNVEYDVGKLKDLVYNNKFFVIQLTCPAETHILHNYNLFELNVDVYYCYAPLPSKGVRFRSYQDEDLPSYGDPTPSPTDVVMDDDRRFKKDFLIYWEQDNQLENCVTGKTLLNYGKPRATHLVFERPAEALAPGSSASYVTHCELLGQVVSFDFGYECNDYIVVTLARFETGRTNSGSGIFNVSFGGVTDVFTRCKDTAYETPAIPLPVYRQYEIYDECSPGGSMDYADGVYCDCCHDGGPYPDPDCDIPGIQQRCGFGYNDYEGTCDECNAELEQYTCSPSEFNNGLCNCLCDVGFSDCEDPSARVEPSFVECSEDGRTLAFDFYTQQATCDMCYPNRAPLPPTTAELPQGCTAPGSYYDSVCDCECDGDYACVDPFYTMETVVDEICCGGDNCYSLPLNDGTYPSCEQCNKRDLDVFAEETRHSKTASQKKRKGKKEFIQYYRDEINT